MDFSKLLDWIKLSPKYLLPISLVSGLLLLSNVPILVSLGLDTFVSQFRPWIGIIFLLSTSFSLSEGILKLVQYFINLSKKNVKKKLLIQRLYELTPEEKNILIYFIVNDTRTQYLSIADGIVKELEVNSIIYRSANVGNVTSWSYNIQPWVWDYIKKNKDKVFSTEDFEIFKKHLRR